MAIEAAMLRLYDYAHSGNAYKVRLLLSQLGIDYERVPVDILKGEARTPEFAAKNPACKVPLLEWPDGRTLSESNAILFHLAEGSEYLPDDSWLRAQVLQWQNFEETSHQPNIGVVRFWSLSDTREDNEAWIPAKMTRGYRALELMNARLSNHDFFVGGRYSIADISLYAYTHVAGEGGFDMTPYRSVRSWIERVRSQPRHVGIAD
jgi:glutathione S-transferase